MEDIKITQRNFQRGKTHQKWKARKGIKRRLKVVNEKVTELEDIAIEMTQKNKMTDRNEQHFCGIKLSSLIASVPDLFG